MTIQIIRDPLEMQHEMLSLKKSGKSLCVVPTMGALHQGHLALINEARTQADLLIVTLFVNPKQFGETKDLEEYPQSFQSDLETCKQQGVHYLFCPTEEAMYPADYCTHVELDSMSETLCGKSRPGHFRGVTTVVTKLLNLTQADCAVFGWKDAQQLLILSRMVEDLHLPVRIIGVETIREADGLACSSRNLRLSAEQRTDALVIYRCLLEARRLVEQEKISDCEYILQQMRKIIQEQSMAEIDYVEAVSMRTLQTLTSIEQQNTLLAVACRWGDVRLIDNIRL